MTNMKHEMTDEMLDNIVGGKQVVIIRAGKKPGTYDALGGEVGSETIGSTTKIFRKKIESSGIRAENLETYKAAVIKMGFEIVMENGG